MLIREDSPVESFRSSDSQLETIAMRGNSPKNVIENDTNLDSNNEMNSEKSTAATASSLLKLYDSATDANQQTCDQLLNMYDTSDGGGSCSGGVVGNPLDNSRVPNNATTWKYHQYSELGLNKLEFKFLNDDPTLGSCSSSDDLTPISPTQMPSAAPYPRKNNSVLKIASSNLEMNKWNNGTPSANTTGGSLNFINGELSSSDDDTDDVFNSCELLNNKSKSVELNEFRMMFGSSPTLLNTNSYNFNPITQTSRLDAVPFQYRRGYSNLNDACLSSSTSDLECFQNSNKKKVFNKNNSELPSLYRHRNNEHLDYIRSFENLDRTRIVRMRNDRITSSSTSTKNSNSSTCSSLHISRDRCLQEEDDDDDEDAFSSYSNLCFENDKSAIGCIGAGSSSSKSKMNKDIDSDASGCGIGSAFNYPSDESIFNINFDNFDDDVLEIDTMRLFENSIDIETSNATNIDDTCCSKSNSNTSTLLLPDINRKLINSDGCNLIKIGGTIPSANSSFDTTTITNIDSTVTNTFTSQNKKSKRLRCSKCNKKLGVIMIMKCHCEKVFCAQHRYAEAHDCTFNFKEEGKKIIAKENPLVIAQKLPKI